MTSAALRDALGLTAVALPIGLGLAAVTLAVHGLRVNAAVQDDLAAEFDELRDALAQPAMAGAGSGGGARSSAADPAERGSRTSRTGPPKRGKGDRVKRRA